eukprot:1137557-Pelagomonas_calceolata.AAC.4
MHSMGIGMQPRFCPTALPMEKWSQASSHVQTNMMMRLLACAMINLVDPVPACVGVSLAWWVTQKLPVRLPKGNNS